MNIKTHFAIRSTVLKGHVNKYAFLGLMISIGSIVVATLLAAYQLTGTISIDGLLWAQTRNPAIWALDLTPFMFAYWGQAFCYELANKAELIIEDKTREYVSKSGDLELKLKYESNHDSLTNLPNNRLLSERINQGIKQIAEGEELAVIIVNINNFKDINYYFGSFSGNSLLMQFTEKLKSTLLEPYMLQAYMGMNMVARLQGAEFAILIPRLKKEHHLEQILENIIDATSVSFMIDGNSIQITTTIGVALYPQHGNNDQTLIHHATLCLLHAEKEGRVYAIYQPSMDRYYKAKRIMLKELSAAIEQQKMDLLFQPAYNLENATIVGAEALVSFNDPRYGVIHSEKLVQLVDGTSLMHNFTVFMLKKSIEKLAQWHKANHIIYIRIGVLSIADPVLPSILENLLRDHQVNPQFLRLEFSEKACLDDQKNSSQILREIAQLGIKLSIADFASGYSSFAYLPNFPINELKIDKSFIMNIVKDEKKGDLVRAMISFAQAMHLEVLADGISDQVILDQLIEDGCHFGQGTYFSKVLSDDDFAVLLNKPRA